MWAGTDAIDVSIPQAEYEVEKGKDITVPCTFKPVHPSRLVMLEWTNIADEVDADAVRRLLSVCVCFMYSMTYYCPGSLT